MKVFHNIISSQLHIRFKIILFLTVCFLFQNERVFSQSYVEGQVFKASDSTLISGASIYFDGTSIGTVSNEKGAFKLSYKETNSLLVVSFLSSEPVFIDLNDDIFKGKRLQIYLSEKLEELDEVELELDTWSREKKMRIFKKQFIGSFPTWDYCKIQNEEAIKLKYIPSSKILVASSKVPLIIKNKKLGYKISYNLTDFEVSFKKTPSGLTLAYKTYYEGFSFFEPLKKKASKKVILNRSENYLGSSLHFLRTLYNETLDENNFKIFHERFVVPPYTYFDITISGTRKSIELKAEKIDILFNDKDQSSFKAKSIFYIDEYGNHSPPDAIIIGGDMSKKRLATLLPLDFEIE